MKKIIILLLLVTLFGCSRQRVPDGFPKLVSVTLTITQEGTPLAGAMVSLIDPSGSVPFTVGGITNEKGSVILYTHGLHKGAPLGKFKVCIVKTESDSVPPAPALYTPEFEAYTQALKKNPPKTYTLVEKRYTNLNTTPLELDISGSLTTTLDVGKMVKDVL